MLHDVVPDGVRGQVLRVLDDHAREVFFAVDVHLPVAQPEDHRAVAVPCDVVALLEQDRVDRGPQRAGNERGNREETCRTS